MRYRGDDARFERLRWSSRTSWRNRQPWIHRSNGGDRSYGGIGSYRSYRSIGARGYSGNTVSTPAPSGYDDSGTTARVVAAIRDQPALNSSGIIVETLNGTVRLNGSVTSQADASKAIQVARNVGGVRAVESNMLIK